MAEREQLAVGQARAIEDAQRMLGYIFEPDDPPKRKRFLGII